MKITAIHLTQLDKKLVNAAIDYYKNGQMDIDGYVRSKRKSLKLTNVENNVLKFKLMEIVGGRIIDSTNVTVEL